jgi:monoamine oxidase
VAQYLDRHADAISQPFVRALVEAGIRTEYGVEPAESSALQLLFNLPTVDGRAVELLGNSDEQFMVRAGTGAFAADFAARLRGQIQLGQRLVRVARQGSGFRLTFHAQPAPLWHDPLSEEDPDLTVSTHLPAGAPFETEVEADYVIVAIPFTVLRQVELPPLPRDLVRFIFEVDLGRNEKVFAGFDAKAWRRDDGFVGECWTDLGFSEVWEESQRQPGRDDGALTFFVGGSQVDAVVGRSAESAGKRFVAELDQALPGVAAAAGGRWFRSKWTRDPFCLGAYSNYRPGQLTRFAPWFWIEGETPAETQESSFGNLLFAGEHLSDAFYGFMNGAAQTGRLAAHAVARRVAGGGIVVTGPIGGDAR